MGGCCGTTPEHIAAIAQKLSANSSQHQMVSSLPEKELGIVRKSPLQQQLEAGKRVIAVEVEPPSTNEIQRLLQTAEQLKLAGADFLTVADCPIARVKADSSMISALLKRQVGIEVIPHLTCRDRNINATKALLLGLQIEEIQTVLLVTGDPLPENVRSEVKSVFQLNASHLCEYVHNLNEENFADTPFFIGAALNVNASNFDVELKRAKQKIAHGANYFLTQPIYSDSAIANVKRAKQELSAYILDGIMPIVSYRNACFINNEISGITIPEEICQRFIEKTPEECRQISIELAYQTCQAIQDVVDGYYITTPLHKVDWVTALMERL